MNRLIKKLKFTGDLEVVTGMRIGAGKDNLEIGGIDLVVVKRGSDNTPYIPGSSLKGKLRCLFEQLEGTDKPIFDSSKQSSRLFGGIAKDPKLGGRSSRLIVRDAFINPDYLMQSSVQPNLIELKSENSIDRIKGSADNPRTGERVSPGVRFVVEFIINVFEGESEADLLGTLKHAVQLLEWDALGGSGSRGYGQVKFHIDWNKPTELIPKLN